MEHKQTPNDRAADSGTPGPTESNAEVSGAEESGAEVLSPEVLSAEVASTDLPPEPVRTPASRAELRKALAVYTVLRFGLFAILTAVFTIFLPLLIAMIFAVIAQLPLSMLLFAGPKQRVLTLMAQGPGAEKARLRAELRGDQVSGDQA